MRDGKAGHLGRAGDKKGCAVSHCQGSNVSRVEAINIFLQADGICHPVSINMLGEWQLHEDTVHIWVGIEVCHHLPDSPMACGTK